MKGGLVVCVGCEHPELLTSFHASDSYVVHGLDGLDEITLTTKTRISSLKDGKVETFQLSPEDLGLDLCEPEALQGGSARENAETMGALFSVQKGPIRDVVLLNAAATLIVAGKAADFAVWNIDRPAELAYRIGFNPLAYAVKGGVVRE